MKILAIDDQQLVLLPLQKRLTEIGYQVKIETDSIEGIKAFDAFEPDHPVFFIVDRVCNTWFAIEFILRFVGKLHLVLV